MSRGSTSPKVTVDKFRSPSGLSRETPKATSWTRSGIGARYFKFSLNGVSSRLHEVGMDAVCELLECEGHNLRSFTAEDDCEALHEVFDLRSHPDL